jgi:hypothetical protein
MSDDKPIIFTNRLEIRPDRAGSGPSKSGPKSDWVAYAVASGVEPEEAKGMTRDELIEEVGSTSD